MRPKRGSFTPLQRGKNWFAYFENLNNAADVMRRGLIFILWNVLKVL